MRAISNASIWSVLAPVRRARRAAAVISSGDFHHGYAGFEERSEPPGGV